MITPTLILGLMGFFLHWSYRHVGITASISRLFYHNKTKKAFKAVLWACGGILVYHDLGNLLLTTAGLALIGVPIFGDFENRRDLTQYAHYLLAFSFFFLTGLYLNPWMLLIMGIGSGIGIKFIRANKLYWLEVMGIITLISGFYIF